jgi:uncharacterized peroxidase-related enzyme
MSRIKPVDPAKATGPAKEMLDAIQKKMGKVPNIFRAMANSPAALGVYLGAAEALSKASLSPAIREQVALTVAQVGSCDYCLAAHTVIGRGAGLTEEQTLAARKGTGTDPKATAALVLARKIVQARGDLSDADIANARKAGLNDGELTEVLAVTCLNIYTNYFNHVNGTDIDFPAAPKLG